MAEVPSRETLKKEIHAILKDADLSKTSARKVRQELEEKLDCDLTDRKKLVDELVMEFINDRSDDEDDDDESEDESEDEKPAKRPAPSKKAAPKKKRRDDSDDGSDDGSDDDYKPNKSKGSSGKAKKKKGSDSDSDDDYKPKKKKAAAGGAKKGGKGGTGFTRPLQLSPELASLMGESTLPRHEVVKKVWALIKERNLYDPKNKQFAICDADLLKVIGVKRFRTFGMMKYLQPHFIG
ncbi:uncharacterized protein LOC134833522 [Culicoides brevitarsis]|uniref:uncharacterized protein LOC134833522 n=1 Tax=Culicoides brevitarsis TaxID=469753 RepID=UPI00307BF295